MNHRPTRHDHLSPLHRVSAWLATAGVLVLTVLAGSPQAHRFLHADAGHAGHVCIVTLAQSGFCDTTAVIAAPVPAGLLSETIPVGPTLSWWSAPDFWHPPSQGPPARGA